MKGNARLIYKSYNTCFRTFLPMYFYGTPNTRIMVLFVREKEDILMRNALEWVVSAHLDFWYDYESDVVFDFQNREYDFEEFAEYVDKLTQRVRPIKTFGNFSSYTEAQQFYNGNTSQMLFNLKPVKAVINY